MFKIFLWKSTKYSVDLDHKICCKKRKTSTLIRRGNQIQMSRFVNTRVLNTKRSKDIGEIGRNNQVKDADWKSKNNKIIKPVLMTYLNCWELNYW